jgi:signal transduction histidine kinase
VTGGARIVVVDDHEAGRFVKCQTLRRAGFTVFEGATGGEGLRLIERERPDLILCDVNLPDMNGLEVTRRVRTDYPAVPAIQILQISSTAVTPSDRVKGLEQGADVYLTEPADSDVLVATVHAMLRVRRAEAAMATALEGERAARAIAEEANRLKDEFIATLSHELRTPLNAMMGWIWQLRHSKLDDAAQGRALDSIERNTRIQAQLINDLLDISRASKGKLPLEMRIVDLEQVTTAAAESIADALERGQLQLHMQLSPAPIAGDQSRVQQIVTNLLTNAIQFTPPDGRINVVLTVEGDDAILTVQDSGAGIDPSLLPHVFDQFRQGEGTLSRRHGGLGLGLAVVRQLIDLHGGSVDVASLGLGHGATFTVRLPRETTLSRDADDESRLLLDDLSILLVAGEGIDPLQFTAILESSGASVTLATDSNGGDESAFDVIVSASSDGAPLGLRLPGSDPTPVQSIARSAPPAEVVRRVAYFAVGPKVRS